MPEVKHWADRKGIHSTNFFEWVLRHFRLQIGFKKKKKILMLLCLSPDLIFRSPPLTDVISLNTRQRTVNNGQSYH